MYNVTLFGLNFNINPIAFTLPIGGGWDIYWYGIIIATGFLLALLYGMYVTKRYNINVDKLLDAVLVTTPVAILSARAYYIIFYNKQIVGFKEFFGFNGSGFSGLAIYGAVIGAVVAGVIMCKILKLNTFDVFDMVATCFLLAQGIGRWGNFVNQEAYGVFTGSSWFGMESSRTIAEMGQGLVHPCFLYESIWCIAGFFILNYFGKHRKFKGELILLYGIWYGFERMLLELIRTDSLMLGRIRISSLLSLILFVTCGILFIVITKRSKSKNEQKEYVPMFSAEIGETEENEELQSGKNN